MKAVVASVLIGIAASYLWNNFRSTTTKVTQTLNESYDYVIVGAGTAGSILAGRLSEDSNVKVLLLEAGGHYDENEASHVPGLWARLLHTDMDWDYYTEPQVNACLGQNNRQAYWPRGRTLGGSNVLNLLQYTRGSRFDFDGWEKQGCQGWSYQEVLPYFKKSEDMLMPDLANSEYHGKGGPMGVTDGRVTDLHDLYLQAGQEMGYNLTDYNGAEQEGFAAYQLQIKDGVRGSTSKFYLETASERPNLHVAIRSFVTKVVMKNKRAIGVYVVRDNKRFFIKANKEVILAAGAINTPQLLMLSGIGPKDHLKEVGIPLVADLPGIGKNLQDHPRVQMFATIEKPLSIAAGTKDSFWNQMKYKFFSAGPLAKTVAEATAFVYTDPNDRHKTGTNLQMNIFSSIGDNNVVNVKDYLHEELRRHKKSYGFTAVLIMNHLKSTGTVTLRSPDPFAYPVMDPKYLSVPSDVDDFVKAIRFYEKFLQTPTIKSLGVSNDHMKVSVCDKHEFRSDAYWECYVRHFAMTTYHQCCTCKMGPAEDPMTVVDSSLRVKGLKGLRVVDASVFPEETSGNLNAPIMMVAEKAADIILQRNSL